MSAITTKFITDHKFTNEMSLEELSQYAPEILELLTTDVPKVDKDKRRQAHDCLQKGYKFSKEQAYALIPHERIGNGSTIDETEIKLQKSKWSAKISWSKYETEMNFDSRN
ncbi:hypothetical protein C1646_760697 [Rhizophagus diaphanus]|nr:hypothetical protein C1646_760697 [Rhizophagus diaphanus] [Rhizophagus sp. MUCL 43196]